jgi:hypothetical protein
LIQRLGLNDFDGFNNLLTQDLSGFDHVLQRGLGFFPFARF